MLRRRNPSAFSQQIPFKVVYRIADHGNESQAQTIRRSSRFTTLPYFVLFCDLQDFR